MMDIPLDCLVIGSGPAGLTTAIYLARFHLRVLVVDDGKSRASTIPHTNNHAGFPNGISGQDLLARMKDQALQFGVDFNEGEVLRLENVAGMLSVHTRDFTWRSQTILLATGVSNNRPKIDAKVHDQAVARGLLRYCPICDGYEVTDQNIAVIGTSSSGSDEALFLRMYTSQVTLIAPDGPHQLGKEQRDELGAAGIVLLDGPCEPLWIDGDKIFVSIPCGELAFDTIYPALGSVINSNLAIALGAQADDEGCLVVDEHQRTTVPGLYAAGDVTMGLDQISHAMGEASVAATAIRNDMASASPLLRG